VRDFFILSHIHPIFNFFSFVPTPLPRSSRPLYVLGRCFCRARFRQYYYYIASLLTLSSLGGAAGLTFPAPPPRGLPGFRPPGAAFIPAAAAAPAFLFFGGGAGAAGFGGFDASGTKAAPTAAQIPAPAPATAAHTPAPTPAPAATAAAATTAAAPAAPAAPAAICCCCSV
jgi:hypothetical protein